jgi:hypothetical protein
MMKKRVFIFFLSLCLLMAALSIVAFAVEDDAVATVADSLTDAEKDSGYDIPGPDDITFSPASVNLGSVAKDSEDTGAALPSQTVTVTNTSDKTMYICDSPRHFGDQTYNNVSFRFSSYNSLPTYTAVTVPGNPTVVEVGPDQSVEVTVQIKATESDSYPATICEQFAFQVSFGHYFIGLPDRYSQSGEQQYTEQRIYLAKYAVEYTLTQPGEDLSFSPTSVDLGTIAAGTDSVSKTVTIQNNGNSVIYFPRERLWSLEGSDSGFWASLDMYSYEPLAPGESCQLTIGFTPDLRGPGTYEATYALATKQGTEIHIPVRIVIAPTTDIAATPGSLDFGTQPEGYQDQPWQKITVTNNNHEQIFVTVVQTEHFIIYADRPFANLSPSYAMSLLEPGGSETYSVKPKTGLKNGTYTDTLTFKIGMFNVKDEENDVIADETVKARFVVGDGSGTGMPFTDVRSNDWFCDSVRYVYENHLMGGTSGTTFSPKEKTTRGMIVTILYRMEKEPSVSAGAAFSDVKPGQYYANAVAWASQNGIVSGYGDGRFGPNDTITREQMAAILYRYAGYKNQDVSAAADISAFADAGSISNYSVQALQWAVSEGLITGTTDTTLSPRGSAQRCEVATILMRFMEK